MLPPDPLSRLLDLSHQLGREDRKLAILGEGNTSVRLSEQTFASRRLFADQIVCCGAESVFVPYTDPCLKLLQAIKTAVEETIARLARPPTYRTNITTSKHLAFEISHNPNPCLTTNM